MMTRVELLGELIDLSHFLGDPQRNLAILGEGNTSARLDEETFVRFARLERRARAIDDVRRVSDDGVEGAADALQ